MRTLFKFSGLLFLTFLMLFSSCEKDSQVDDIIEMHGQVTPVGDVQETGTTTIIGVSGGTIQSADGHLHLTIPAGAVTENTSFSVQHISNTNIAGVGEAYRLLPHGTHFSAPITVSFAYDTADFEGTPISAVGIAFQDDKGIWQGSGAIHDPIANTLSVSTTHFSDWSLFKSFAINPVSASVEPGKSLTLNVVNCMSDEDLIPPVPGVEKPIGPQHSATTKYIKEWKLGDEGVLKANGAEADYTAPATMPSKNPVAVSVSLKGPGNGQYLLVSNIYIGGEGITFRIDNGPWRRGTIPQGGVVEAAGFQNLDAVIEPLSAGDAYGALSLKWSGYPSGGI